MHGTDIVGCDEGCLIRTLRIWSQCNESRQILTCNHLTDKWDTVEDRNTAHAHGIKHHKIYQRASEQPTLGDPENPNPLCY